MSQLCLFGAIADDYTGGADLAGMLHENGVRTVQVFGLRPERFMQNLRGRYQAAVLCLKSRSIPASEACVASLAALDSLKLLEPGQIQFKYCSTFDSTAQGNIGPVADAMMRRLETAFTIAVPALPVNQRTQYQGYLFVGSQLLSESHMRHHPVNPMTDSNLVRHLQLQTSRKVGLIDLQAVRAGAEAICSAMQRLRDEGIEIALVDAVTDSDMENIAKAAADLPLITGGSGLGMKLPAVWRARGLISAAAADSEGAGPGPREVLILSGSCSAATLRQLAILQESGVNLIRMDLARLLSGGASEEIGRLYAAGMNELRQGGAAAIVSSAAAEEREQFRGRAQSAGLDPEQASACIESAFGEIARRFANDGGVRNLVVAGGETSGAVINALDIPAVEIAGILDPGVPSLRSLGEPPLALALKSGNFGSPDFFLKTIQHLRNS